VVGGLELAYPEYPHHEARDAAVYVRPHELVIERNSNGTGGIEAEVLHVNPTGSRVKVELRSLDSDRSMNAEITPERLAELSLRSGDTVYVSARRVRVFMPASYAI
jgi:sulfate transport system ATP-binding protein